MFGVRFHRYSGTMPGRRVAKRRRGDDVAKVGSGLTRRYTLSRSTGGQGPVNGGVHPGAHGTGGPRGYVNGNGNGHSNGNGNGHKNGSGNGSGKGQGPDKDRKRRVIDPLDILIFITALLVLLAIFIGIMVVSFPEASKGVLADVKAAIVPYVGDKPTEISTKVANRARDGFEFRLKPLAGWVAGVFAPKQEAVSKAEKRRAAVDFSGCLSCHENLYDRPAFTGIYMDHRLHKVTGVDCATCHLDSKHPKPATVKQSICIGCHRDNQVAVNCKSCHAPGSILGGDVVPVSDTEQFLAGRTSSTKVLVPQGFEHPVGEGAAPCKQCHDYPEFCNRCHSMKVYGVVGSPHASNWIPTHGPRIILKREFATNGCWNCHSSNFCASACHPNPGRQRLSPNWKLPQLELR